MFSLVRETWPCLTAGKAKIGICFRGLAFSLVRETWPCLTAGKAILSFGSSEGDLSSRGWSTNSLVTDWLTYSVMVFGNILQFITASYQSKSLSGLIGINCILCKMSFRYDGSRRVVFKHDASKCFIQNMTFKMLCQYVHILDIKILSLPQMRPPLSCFSTEPSTLGCSKGFVGHCQSKRIWNLVFIFLIF